MLLPKSVRHGIYALCYMSRQPAGTIVPAGAISSAMDVPLDHAAKILQSLKTAGMIQSVRGRSGGYRTVKQLDAISVADVLRAVAPPLSEYGLKARSCPLAQDNGCTALPGLIALHDGILEFLSQKTLASVLDITCAGVHMTPAQSS